MIDIVMSLGNTLEVNEYPENQKKEVLCHFQMNFWSLARIDNLKTSVLAAGYVNLYQEGCIMICNKIQC